MATWKRREVASRSDSIGQEVKPGNLVAFNHSGSVAFGRISALYDGGGYSSSWYDIIVLRSPHSTLEGKVAKVKNYISVLRINSIPNSSAVSWE